MSYEELDQQGLMLPEEQHDDGNQKSIVNRVLLGGIGLLGAAACLLIATGAGGPRTWMGAGLFVVFLVAFTLVSNHSVERQNERIEDKTNTTERR